MITLKEAFEDLHDRLMKQVAEKMWEIERVEPLEGDEFYDFVGAGVVKNKLMKKLKRELKELQGNLEVIKKIIKQYGKNSRGEK